MPNHLTEEAIDLLKNLIAIPSFSRQEEHTATLLYEFLDYKDCHTFRLQNNVWAIHRNYDDSKPNILLNSHHDTVRPNASYTKNPHFPLVEGDKLYGLGSNDAGASLVGLMATFLFFSEENLPFNLVFAASAEEEISGPKGMTYLREELPQIHGAIVGEPTMMKVAVAEKGLCVIDGTAFGKSGHAAREEGENAILIAMQDILNLDKFKFEKISKVLGPVKQSVTIVNGGTQHNVVPDRCTFTIDVRTNELYTNEEATEILQSLCKSELKARSYRLNSSSIPHNHPLYRTTEALNIETYGSPTLSDQALMPWPSIKMGIGDSARSHTADEYVYISEIEEGINRYIRFIEELENHF